MFFRRPFIDEIRLFAADALNLRRITVADFKCAFGCAAAGYGNNTVSAVEADRFFYAHADSSGCQFLNIGVGVSGIV